MHLSMQPQSGLVLTTWPIDVLALSQNRNVTEAEKASGMMTCLIDAMQAERELSAKEIQSLRERIIALGLQLSEQATLHIAEREADQQRTNTGEQRITQLQTEMASLTERKERQAADLTEAKVAAVQAATAAGVARVAAVQGDLEAAKLEIQALRAQLTQQAEAARVERESATKLADARLASTREEVTTAMTHQMNSLLDIEHQQAVELRRQNDKLRRMVSSVLRLVNSGGATRVWFKAACPEIFDNI